MGRRRMDKKDNERNQIVTLGCPYTSRALYISSCHSNVNKEKSSSLPFLHPKQSSENHVTQLLETIIGHTLNQKLAQLLTWRLTRPPARISAQERKFLAWVLKLTYKNSSWKIHKLADFESITARIDQTQTRFHQQIVDNDENNTTNIKHQNRHPTSWWSSRQYST